MFSLNRALLLSLKVLNYKEQLSNNKFFEIASMFNAVN